MLFLAPAELRGLDAPALDDLLVRSDLLVAFGDGEVRGRAAAALLFADYAVLGSGASLVVDTAEGWAGVVWRLGGGGVRWWLEGADAAGIVDETSGLDPERWLEQWMRGRSALALDAAAALIRLDGGDRLERFEFARLFATGEPQKGLAAFLSREKAPF